MRELRVAVEGYELAVRDWGGHGPPLLLLHGGGANLASFDALAPLLTDAFRVVGYDAMGHGLSGEPPPERVERDLFLLEVDAVTAALELDRPVLVGASMGGATAHFYAWRRECAGIVAVDGAVPRVRDEIEARPPTDPGEYERQLLEWGFGWVGDAAGVERQVADWVRDDPEIDPALTNAQARRSYEPMPGGRFRRKPTLPHSVAMRLLGERIPPEDQTIEVYNRISCPVLLLCAERGIAGGGGPYSDEHRARLNALPDRYPSIEVEWLDGGHRLELELPGQVADRIRRFATRVRSFR